MPRTTRRPLALLAATVAALGTMAPTALAAQQPSLPTVENPGGLAAPHSPGGVPSGPTGAFRRTAPLMEVHPGTSPQGANDFSCRPAPGRRPVVLVAGTTEDAWTNWAFMAPMLAADGWCVFTPNYNPQTTPAGQVDEMHGFTGDIRSSAAFLAGFVDRVLAATGSEKVDLVGHSQGGGPLPRAYLKWYGGADKVDQLVGLTPSNRGTTVGGLENLLRSTDTALDGALSSYASEHNMDSLPQQLSGSSFMKELNDGAMTVPGVRYTVIASRTDTVVTPWTNSLLPTADNVRNVVLQDVCPADLTGHPGISYDANAYQLVRNTLAGEPDRPVRCGWIPPRPAVPATR